MNQLRRILLVEDNPGDVDLTQETLRDGDATLAFSIAIDGIDAIAKLEASANDAQEAFDLVLLDLNLPRKSGHDVLAHLRAHPTLARLPVVVLTSSDAAPDIAESYALGANCYVTKPVGLEQFEAAVRSIQSFWLGLVRLP